MDFFSDISWQTAFEIGALITGIVCVTLQVFEKVAGWIFGIISVTLLACIFFDTKLYSDFILHIIFLLLNIYGWWNWIGKKTEKGDSAPVLRLVFKEWIFYLGIVVLVSPLWGYGMNRMFGAELAYFDAFTTVGSLVAQYLLARKYLENWILWIIVDVVAIGVYIYKDLYFVAALFFTYLMLSVWAYLLWQKKMKLTI